MERFGEPEEIGGLVLFICSDACEFSGSALSGFDVGKIQR
jgi:hypothetical protein